MARYRRTTRRAPRRRYAPRRRRAYRRPVRRHAYRPRAPIHRRRFGGGRRRYHARRYGSRTVMRNPAMRAMTTRQGDLVIEKMEYIGDLIPSTNGSFLSQVYNANIGLATFAPWGSGLADNFELYDPTHMSIILKSTSGNAFSSVNAATGSMGVCALYNVYTPTVQVNNKVIAESLAGAKSGNPNKSQVFHVDVKHNRNPQDTYYIRYGALPAGQSLNQCDICNLIVWSQGLQTTTASAIAEIWIKYRIVLKSPRPGAGQLGFSIMTAKYQYSSTVSATVPTYNNLWGGSGGSTTYVAAGSTNALAANSNNNLTFTFANNGSTSGFAFPSNIVCGNYLVVYRATGSNVASALTQMTLSTLTNCTGNVIFAGALNAATGTGQAGSFATLSINGSATGVTYCVVQAITVTAANATVVWTPTNTLPSSITSMDFMVTQINGAITTIT